MMTRRLFVKCLSVSVLYQFTLGTRFAKSNMPVIDISSITSSLATHMQRLAEMVKSVTTQGEILYENTLRRITQAKQWILEQKEALGKLYPADAIKAYNELKDAFGGLFDFVGKVRGDIDKAVGYVNQLKQLGQEIPQNIWDSLKQVGEACTNLENMIDGSAQQEVKAAVATLTSIPDKFRRAAEFDELFSNNPEMSEKEALQLLGKTGAAQLQAAYELQATVATANKALGEYIMYNNQMEQMKRKRNEAVRQSKTYPEEGVLDRRW